MIPLQSSQYHVSRYSFNIYTSSLHEILTSATRYRRRWKDLVTRLNGLLFPDLLEHRLPPPLLRALPVVYSRLPLASHLFSPDKPLPFKAYSSLQASQEAWDCLRVVECFNQERLQALILFPAPSCVEKAGRRALPLFQTLSCSHSQLVSWQL